MAQHQISQTVSRLLEAVPVLMSLAGKLTTLSARSMRVWQPDMLLTSLLILSWRKLYIVTCTLSLRLARCRVRKNEVSSQQLDLLRRICLDRLDDLSAHVLSSSSDTLIIAYYSPRGGTRGASAPLSFINN